MLGRFGLGYLLDFPPLAERELRRAAFVPRKAGYWGHVAVDPETEIINDEKLTRAVGQRTPTLERQQAAEQP